MTQPTLISLYCADVDTDRIFGVIPKTWQIYIIYYVALGRPLKDLSVPIKYLEKNEVSIVEPFRSVLFESSVFKEVNMALPFKSPYLILNVYIKRKNAHLYQLQIQCNKRQLY